MNGIKRNILIHLSPLLFLAAVSSCSLFDTDYGVVLEEEEALPLETGSIVEINEVNKDEATFTVSPTDNNIEYKSTKKHIARFDTYKKAKNYAKEYFTSHHTIGAEKRHKEKIQSALVRYTWRPEYISSMIEENRKVPQLFDPKIGLFFDKKRNRITLITHNFTRRYTFEDAKTVDNQTIIFAEGSLKLVFIHKDEIVVEYRYRGNLSRERYIPLDVSAEQAINNKK